MKTHIIPAAHGFAFEVKEGERFRIVDLSVLTVYSRPGPEITAD